MTRSRGSQLTGSPSSSDSFLIAVVDFLFLFSTARQLRERLKGRCYYFCCVLALQDKVAGLVIHREHGERLATAEINLGYSAQASHAVTFGSITVYELYKRCFFIIITLNHNTLVLACG